MMLPPPRKPDPDIVDAAISTTRALSRADTALDRRKRLNLELARAEDVIRNARGSRGS